MVQTADAEHAVCFSEHAADCFTVMSSLPSAFVSSRCATMCVII